MEDFNIESLHQAITPVCFTVGSGGGGDQFAVVRISGNDVQGTIRAIEDVWQKFTPNMPFQYDFFTDRWNNLYSSELKTGRIFLIFSFLAIFIACLGLIGLVTYVTNKRTKEIGIRKSYGASERVVLGLLSREVIYLDSHIFPAGLSCRFLRVGILAGRVREQGVGQSAYLCLLQL